MWMRLPCILNVALELYQLPYSRKFLKAQNFANKAFQIYNFKNLVYQVNLYNLGLDL